MIFLIIFNIIVAASLLFTGYYIKRNPHDQFKDSKFYKSEVIEQYGIEISKAFKFAGIFVIVFSFVTFLINSEILSFSTSVVVPFGAGIYALIKRKIVTQKTSTFAIIFLTATLILLMSIIPIAYIEPNIIIHKENITISGVYGESIPLDQISHVQLIEATPKIKLRTNGIAIGEIKKGYFSTDTLGNIKLIVHKDKKPFLHIETENKRHIIINFRDPNKTLVIYNSIMQYRKQ